MHHPRTDAFVIIARVVNNNVHRLLVDDGSAIDIIYLDAYKRMGLIESELNPATSLLYEFTGYHVIPRGTVKLAVTVGEHPRVWTVVTEFLIVDCPLGINRIIERPLLKALKAVTSIYHLTMKFPTIEEQDKFEALNMTREKATTSQSGSRRRKESCLKRWR